MLNKRGEVRGSEPSSLSNKPGSRARAYASENAIAAADVGNRRPSARRVSWLGSFPWRQLALSALAGALAAVLATLALVWSGWTIG